MTDKIKNLDIIVPIRNEADNIVELVKRIDTTFKKYPTNYKLIFIDDFSTDDTLKILNKLSKKHPIEVYTKKGEVGKGYSILEGVEIATAEHVAFIDGDNQYPAEKFTEMLEKFTTEVGVVIGNRKEHKTENSRKIGSKLNAVIVGKYLLGINHDIQSGMKVFRKDIFKYINQKHVTPWTFDIPLLDAAKQLGYEIQSVDITFNEREGGQSKVGFIKTAAAIIICALKTKLSSKSVYNVGNESESIGSGVFYNKSEFITHTKLPHHKSALYTFKRMQKVFFALAFALFTIGMVINPLGTLGAFIAVLSTIYFLDVLFTLFIVSKSLKFPPEVSFNEDALESINDEELPIYSILCPLFKEKQILPYFVDAISKLDWPKDKLDVLLLLEEVDKETIEAAQQMELPEYFRIIVVPHSNPQTKPKACNYGLHMAKGKYVVIYDAEDIPDIKQLKKAHLAFQELPENILCVQAKLNYFNPNQNLLTTMFTAEYSLWFDIMLPGLQSIETTIPLGGTSNHFKREQLIALHGWDPFNVTEDCDLGARIFKEGYKTAIIDSTTYEEANSNVKNWIRQRSRWIKGYWQTYLVHMRDPLKFFKQHGFHAVLFQLIIGLRTTFILINPVLWVLTVSYFTLYKYVGSTIEALYPPYVFYMAVFSLIFGNFMYLYNYMIGLAKRQTWWAIKYVFFIPFYWFLTSIAAFLAFYQLIVKPHYWEKTTHGLHIKSKKNKAKLLKGKFSLTLPSIQIKKPNYTYFDIGLSKNKLVTLVAKNTVVGAGILAATSMAGNFLNYLYNAYLTRNISLEDFGLISLIGNFLFLSTIPLSALSRSVTYKTSYFLGKYNGTINAYWKYIRKRSLVLGFALMVAWLLLLPVLENVFKAPNAVPFLIFAPVWVVLIIYSVDRGFINGSHKFVNLAAILLIEAISKLIFTIIFVSSGHVELVYIAIPLSISTALLFSGVFAKRINYNPVVFTDEELKEFPKRFFTSSLLMKFSTVAFLSFDVMLAKIFLSPNEAGKYALIALTGKMIYTFGALFSEFILPLLSKEQGANIKKKNTFKLLLGAAALSSTTIYIIMGVFGHITAPLLFGPKMNEVAHLLPLYGFGILLFTIANSVVSYNQVRNKHSYVTTMFVIALTQIAGIALFHKDAEQITQVMAITAGLDFVIVLILHFAKSTARIYSHNLENIKDLFREKSLGDIDIEEVSSGLNILIFNWRDTKHVWAGGAEVYIHEIAKQLIKKNHKVTVFCGNDLNNPSNEVIDGVQVVRKGGFYTVYLWAFLYYTFKLRGKFDVVIDSENGIPFFTPLYVKEPVIGLIHHIHQDFFKKYPPKQKVAAAIATFVEAKLMPLVYKNSKLITVSESSKTSMEALGMGKKHGIDIVNPGVELDAFKRTKKTVEPTILYLGRLKEYKSIDVVIKAMEHVNKTHPTAKLKIAGFGEARGKLEELTSEMGLTHTVEFLGKVTEEEKVELMGQSWVFTYPSSHEGWGIAVIEANACGTPVVAANVPGLKESVSNPHTGYLVDFGSVESFAEKFCELISDTKLRKNLEKHCLVWAEGYTWEKSTDTLLLTIGNLITKGPNTKFENKDLL